jgi:hypothetical protein
VDPGANFFSAELMGRTFVVASQIMCCFKRGDPFSDQLEAAFIDNIGAAKWAFNWASSYVSTSCPAGETVKFNLFSNCQLPKFVISERDLQDLRLVELTIFSGLWLADLSKLCGFYKTSCNTLQTLLIKLQKLHFASRYVIV